MVAVVVVCECVCGEVGGGGCTGPMWTQPDAPRQNTLNNFELILSPFSFHLCFYFVCLCAILFVSGGGSSGSVVVVVVVTAGGGGSSDDGGWW